MCYNQRNVKKFHPHINIEKNSDSIKTILLGEYGVGKTSIISCFMNPNQKELKTTIQIEYCSKSLLIEENVLYLIYGIQWVKKNIDHLLNYFTKTQE